MSLVGESGAGVSRRPQVPLLAGLDGIRALAVLAVVLFHSELDGLAPGGFLGVDVFFTLSGFLITSLLLREFEATGGIDVKDFYLRRVRRLLPAMLAVAVAAAIAALLWAPDAAQGLRQDLPAALLYAANWWQLVAQQSYFEMFGRPPLLQHLWSLAIEEQFYLVWPVLALGLLRWLGRRGLLWCSAALALGVTAWMAHLAVRAGIPAEVDPNRLYLATDTHSMGLLAGAWLGCLWNPWAIASAPAHSALLPRVAGRRFPLAREVLGWAGLAGVIAAFAWLNEANAWLYRGGFLAVSLMTLAVIAAAADNRTLLSAVLAVRPLRWLGERSYGLYLWHWPVFVLLRPGHELPDDPVLAVALRWGLTLLITELSYRFIENPIRRGRLSLWTARQWSAAAGYGVAGLAAMALLYGGAWPAAQRTEPTTLASAAPRERGPESLPPAVVVASVAAVDAAPQVLPEPGCDEVACAAAQPVSVGTTPEAAPGVGDPRWVDSVSAEGNDAELTAIGDSVLLGARGYLARAIQRAEVDARVGRQGSEGLQRIRELKAQSKLADVVMVHLGTNGYLHEPHVNEILAELGDRRRVIVVNVRAARRWERVNNGLLQRMASRYDNVTLVNWHGLSRDHPEYFVADGVHLSGPGIRAFVEQVRVAGGFPSRRKKLVAAREATEATSDGPRPARVASVVHRPAAKPPAPATPGLSPALMAPDLMLASSVPESATMGREGTGAVAPGVTEPGQDPHRQGAGGELSLSTASGGSIPPPPAY